LGDADPAAGHYQTAILPTLKSYSLLLRGCATVSDKLHCFRPVCALAARFGGLHTMLEFVLGFAFVAMILSPAALATCLRHFSRMEPHPVPADNLAQVREHAGREQLRRAS
jgi:hypothetical protein